MMKSRSRGFISVVWTRKTAKIRTPFDVHYIEVVMLLFVLIKNFIYLSSFFVSRLNRSATLIRVLSDRVRTIQR